jgi:hypothetical protein
MIGTDLWFPPVLSSIIFFFSWLKWEITYLIAIWCFIHDARHRNWKCTRRSIRIWYLYNSLRRAILLFPLINPVLCSRFSLRAPVRESCSVKQNTTIGGRWQRGLEYAVGAERLNPTMQRRCTYACSAPRPSSTAKPSESLLVWY